MLRRRAGGLGRRLLERVRERASVPEDQRSEVEWLPARDEELRVSKIIDRPLSDLERILHVEPEELIRLAYGAEPNDGSVVVSLRPWPGVSWLRVPVAVECRTPGGEHGAVGAAIRWRASRLRTFFPVMEGDLRGRPDGDGRSALVFHGHYRPPLGLIGLLCDRLVARWIAVATAQRFVEQLARIVEEGVL